MTLTILVLILCSVRFSSAWAQFENLPSFGYEKTWYKFPQQNWRDWSTRITLGDINFPTNLELPLAFPSSDGESCEIVIPMDEVVSVEEEVILSQTAPTCPKEAGTLPEDDILWINPYNWIPHWMSQDFTLAVPHVERIPCKFDTVQFIYNLDNFIIILPPKNISIREIVLGDYVINRYNYRYFKKRERFVKHFFTNSELEFRDIVNISSRECTDPTGCECGTMHLYEEVCAIVKPKCKLTLPCPYPIQPFGHCCAICGAYIHVNYDPNEFVFTKLFRFIERYFQEETIGIQWHVSKISEGTIQIVVTSYKYHTINEIYFVATHLSDIIKQEQNLGLIGIPDMTISGVMHDPKQWTKTLYIIVYSLGSIALLIGVYFFYIPKLTKPLPKFAKNSLGFKKPHGAVEEDKLVEEVEKNEDNQRSHKNRENAENGTKLEFDHLFIELPHSSKGEDVRSTLKSKNLEDEILLDLPTSTS